MALEVIVHQDDREQITDSSDFPWRCTCMLIMTAQRGNRFIGTGWLAAPRLVVTAGRCVYFHDDGGWPAQIDAYAARNGSDAPFSYTSVTFRSVNGWVQDHRP